MPDPKETADLLAKVPLFENLKRGQLERLAKQFELQAYEAGQAIVTQGEGGTGFYILVSGRAEVIHLRPDGTKTVVNYFGPGEFFGELALLTDGPRTASIIAAEPTQCQVLPRWHFLGQLEGDAKMATAILVELAERFSMALGVL